MNNILKTDTLNGISILMDKYRNNPFFERAVKELVLQKNAPRAVRRGKLYSQLEWLLKEMNIEELEAVAYVRPK